MGTGAQIGEASLKNRGHRLRSGTYSSVHTDARGFLPQEVGILICTVIARHDRYSGSYVDTL